MVYNCVDCLVFISFYLNWRIETVFCIFLESLGIIYFLGVFILVNGFRFFWRKKEGIFIRYSFGGIVGFDLTFILNNVDRCRVGNWVEVVIFYYSIDISFLFIRFRYFFIRKLNNILVRYFYMLIL